MKINSKLKALEWSQYISHYKSIENFFRRSRAANSTVQGQIWPNFESIRDFMVVLVTCKHEEDPIKNERARVVTLFIDFSDAQGQLPTSEVSDGILPKFKLIQAIMVGLVTCKNEEDPSKNDGTRLVTIFLHYKSMGIFIRRSRAANSQVPGLILQNFEPMQDFMVVLVTCKYKEEPIKNEGARVVTRFSPL